jgi:DNA-binding helix-hairpin-helix protein with protein kinase domain
MDGSWEAWLENQTMHGSYCSHQPKVQHHVAALAVVHIAQVLSKVERPFLTSGVERKVVGGHALETAIAHGAGTRQTQSQPGIRLWLHVA